MYFRGTDPSQYQYTDHMQASPLYRPQKASQQPASSQPTGFKPLKINPAGRAEPKIPSYGTPYSSPPSLPAASPAVPAMQGYGSLTKARKEDDQPYSKYKDPRSAPNDYGRGYAEADGPGKKAYEDLMAHFAERSEYERKMLEFNRNAGKRAADFQKEYWDNWNGGVVVPAPRGKDPLPRLQGWKDDLQFWPQSTFDGDPQGALAGVPPSQRPPAFQVSPAQTPWGTSTDPFTERDALIRRLNEQRIARGVAMNRAGTVPPDTWGRMMQLNPAAAMQGLGNLAPRTY